MDYNVKMEKVDSSFLTQIGYDADKQTLVVEMDSLYKKYVYKDVPPSIYKDFLAAESKGKFYSSTIKGRFGVEREQ